MALHALLSMCHCSCGTRTYSVPVSVSSVSSVTCSSDVWSNEFAFIDNLDLIQYSSLEELDFYIKKFGISKAYIRDYNSAKILIKNNMSVKI